MWFIMLQLRQTEHNTKQRDWKTIHMRMVLQTAHVVNLKVQANVQQSTEGMNSFEGVFL